MANKEPLNFDTLNSTKEITRHIKKTSESFIEKIYGTSDYNLEFARGYIERIFGRTQASIFNIRLLKQLIQLLPDIFPKHPKSNIIRFLYIIYDESIDLINTLNFIELYKDIDLAEGDALNKIGKNVNVYRKIGQSDASFKDEIRLKIASNLSKGDINTLSRILKSLLGEDFVKVHEGWAITGNPAELMVEISGDEVFLDDFERIINVANSIKAAGVEVISFYQFEDYNFNNTMIFGHSGTIDLYNKNYLDGSSNLDGTYNLDMYGSLE